VSGPLDVDVALFVARERHVPSVSSPCSFGVRLVGGWALRANAGLAASWPPAQTKRRRRLARARFARTGWPPVPFFFATQQLQPPSRLVASQPSPTAAPIVSLLPALNGRWGAAWCRGWRGRGSGCRRGRRGGRRARRLTRLDAGRRFRAARRRAARRLWFATTPRLHPTPTKFPTFRMWRHT
jgi:hypothetical protein